MQDKYAVVGKSVQKIDAVDRVTGMQVFTTDVELPRMLHAKMLKSPYGHAKIKSIDVSAVKKMPGVRGVITFEDTPKMKFNPWVDVPNWVEPRELLALTDSPMYNGDAIAAVAATDEETASEAVARIEVEYEVLPAVTDAIEAMNPGAPQLHEGYPNNIMFTANQWIWGDVERAFKESDFIASGTFKTENMSHSQLECHCSLADYDPYHKQLTLYTTTQNPFPLMDRIKEALGLDIPVRVIARPIGGAFGANHELFQHDACATILSMKLKQPVRIALSRDETFKINKRYGMHFECRMGAKKDGKFTAIEGKLVGNGGAYQICTLANTSLPLNQIHTLYSFPNSKLEAVGVYTNTNPNVPFRGFGNPQGFFAFEQLIDELAEKAGMDPLEMRKINIKKVGDPSIVAPGTTITTNEIIECMRIGAETIGWDRRKNLDRSGTKKRGLGMACLMHVTGCTKMADGWNESSTGMVEINHDGSVTLTTGVSDLGTGSRTTLAQLVAEEMGVPFESVKLSALYADTLTQPWEWGAYGSRTLCIGGMAAKQAATKVKEMLLSFAAEKLEANPVDLEVKEGKIYVKGSPDRSTTVGEVATFAIESKHAGTLLAAVSFYPTENPPPVGAQFVELEVDTETGKITILKFVPVQDVGRAINPAIVRGQLEGAVVMGMGFAMSEQLKWDGEGKLLTNSFRDYIVQRSTDIPREMNAIYVESNDPNGPFGAKGVGEPGMIATAAAIANAFYNATGVRMRELIFSPANVLKTLGKI